MQGAPESFVSRRSIASFDGFVGAIPAEHPATIIAVKTTTTLIVVSVTRSLSPGNVGDP